MNNSLEKYRDDLLNTLRFLNESYDKILLTLSGGALGLSIAFLKDIIQIDNILHGELLFLSWLFFILSLASVLGRLLFGIESYRKAVKQVDDGEIYNNKPGGRFSTCTRVCHIGAVAFLLIGLFFIVSFAYINLGGQNGERKTKSEAFETTCKTAKETTSSVAQACTREKGTKMGSSASSTETG